MRLIDADALMDELYGNLCDGEILYRIPPNAIDNAPTVDAVPVVRCKDCKYAAKAKWNKKGYRICPASHMEITNDDFCSYGERNGT